MRLRWLAVVGLGMVASAAALAEDTLSPAETWRSGQRLSVGGAVFDDGAGAISPFEQSAGLGDPFGGDIRPEGPGLSSGLTNGLGRGLDQDDGLDANPLRTEMGDR